MKALARAVPPGLFLACVAFSGIRAGEIHDAAKAGDLAAVRRLLDASPDLAKTVDQDGNTPLHHAVTAGSVSVAGLLLDRGATVDAQNRAGDTALHLAAWQGDTAVAGLLLDRRADANAVDRLGKSVLTAAIPLASRLARAVEAATAGDSAAAASAGAGDAAAGDQKGAAMVSLLLQRGARPDDTDAQGLSALHTAVLCDQPAVVHLLLEHGAKTEAACQTGWTALHFAACLGSTSSARALLGHGARVNSAAPEAGTPLHVAAFGGQRETAEVLLQGGADVDARNSVGLTALHRAVATNWGHRTLRDVLLLDADGLLATLHGVTQAASPDMRERLVAIGETLKRLLPEFVPDRPTDFPGTAKLLLGHKADLEARTDRGMTPLIAASMQSGGATEAVALLLDAGADLGARDVDGFTALHGAAEHGFTEVVRLLLDRGADVASVTNEKQTPLHAAAPGGHDGVVELLLSRGARPDAREHNGATPLHVACLHGRPRVVSLLLKADADPNVVSVSLGLPPLHCAVMGQRIGRASARLAVPADKQGRFHKPSFGTAEEYREVVVQLLAAGADLRAKGRPGRTAREAATQGDLLDIVGLLAEAESKADSDRARETTGALEELRRRAGQGERETQYELAEAYRTGRWGQRDYEQAIRWYKEAARNGQPKALYQLGIMLYKGQVVERDCRQAYAYLLLAREGLEATGTSFDADQEKASKCVKDATTWAERRQANRITEQIRRELLLPSSP